MQKLRRGFSLTETMFVALFTAVILTASMVLTVGVGRSYNRTSYQFEVDQSASRGVLRLTDDFQEAKSFQIISSTHVRIFYPVMANGTYNRRVTDTVNTIDYFRGNKNGSENTSGTCLVRLQAGSEARAVIENLNFLQFVSDSPSSVSVDVRCSKTVGGKSYACSMNHRAILMRNYSP